MSKKAPKGEYIETVCNLPQSIRMFEVLLTPHRILVTRSLDGLKSSVPRTSFSEGKQSSKQRLLFAGISCVHIPVPAVKVRREEILLQWLLADIVSSAKDVY
jgi:hypothetical protein